VLQNVDPAQQLLAAIQSGLQLDGVTTYLKLDGRILRMELSYFDRVIRSCKDVVWSGITGQSVGTPTGSRWSSIVMMMITTCTAGSVQRE